MRKKRFTLLELLGVMIIIALISAYTIPQSNAVMQELRVKDFTKEISEKTHLAQLRSQEEKTFYIVKFQNEEYSIINQESNGLVSINSYPKNVSFHSSSFENNELIFTTDGSPANAGEILFRYGEERKIVKIFIEPATGRVKSEW